MAERLRHPPVVKYLVGNEVAERFSYHGMRGLLVIYMVQYLAFSEKDAKEYFHLFVMATYLTPLVGGWIADRSWGRYRTILWISFAYVLGHAVLALWETPWGLFVGLAFIAAGAGSLEPCRSAFIGDQRGPEQQTLTQRVYGWFHWSIHLGSACAYLLMPWLRRTYGPTVAFAVAGAFMAIALLVFWAGSRHYVRAPPSGPAPHGFLRVVATAGRKLGMGRPGEHWLDAARAAHPAEAVEGAKVVVRIMGVFAAVTSFWALFHQRSSAWVIQARQMDLELGLFALTPEQGQVANPLLVLTLVPLFSLVAFPFLERRGVDLSPLKKMTAGMFVTVLSFGAAALVQTAIDAGGAPSVLWQVPQYVLLTAGEVLVSVTGLEFSYAQAPRAMRSTIMSLWFLAIALGNLLTAVIIRVVPLDGAAYFWFFSALMLLAALAFRFVARRYRPAPAFVPAATPVRG